MNKFKKIMAEILSVSIMLYVLSPITFAKNDEYATREYIVSQFVQSVGRNSIEPSDAVLDMFSDSKDISVQYRDDISRAIVAGILKGYGDHTIRPDEPVKRVEALVMLARCVPDIMETEKRITFTDVPEWAEEDIAYLTGAGLLMGYGDGTMGANDPITTEQVKILVERSDEALRSVNPGDSFYGYINEKTFRNAVMETTTEIDPLHGAVVTKHNSWSHFDDIAEDITTEEKEILEKLMNGEIEFEDGSTEQRIHDMLECIDSDNAISDGDKKNISDMRKAILDAKTIEELLKVNENIYKQAGINVLFDIGVDTDKETGLAYPTFSIAAAGDAGFLAFRKSTDTDEYRDVYGEIVLDYMDVIGADFTIDDVEDAIELQELSSLDSDHYTHIVTMLVFAQLFGIIDEAGLMSEMENMAKEHPELYDEKTDSFNTPYIYYESYSREKADANYTGFDLCEELTKYGFTNLEKIIVPTDYIAKAEKDLICDKNLDALKINALLTLSKNLEVNLNEEEESNWNKLSMFSLMVCMTGSAQVLSDSFKSSTEETNAEAEESFEEGAGMEFDEGVLSAVNLNQLRNLMPDDIGLLHCKYYYDDDISKVIEEMFHDIWDAYEARFKNNTWMQEETKKNAIKKLDNMIAIVAYPDNYTFPEIVPMSEGGTLFSNTLNVKRHEVSELIRTNEDKEFIRTLMYMPPDMVNACYIPSRNTINVPAGILNAPMYDGNASYAANLGSIGMVIAHEIGHAFDESGSQYDENGCIKDWWTEKDANKFQEIQDYFVEYYNQFEVAEGVVQDANITIGENMADFAAMQVLMDIIGDDKVAQKECFEAYARMWAQLGTISYLTDSSVLGDVHAANVVRVNAVVASFDQFYEIYDVQEGDAMYVAPEKRLKLW